MLCVDIHRQALNTRLSGSHGPDARESLSRASLALKFVVMLHVRLHSFFGILGNSVLVTLGGACHSRGAVAVAPIWRVALDMMMSKMLTMASAVTPLQFQELVAIGFSN